MKNDSLEQSALRYKSLQLRLRRLIGDDVEKDLDSVVKRLHQLAHVSDYAVRERDDAVAFERNCAAITENLHKDAKRMSVFEYYTALMILSERAKEQQKK